MNANALAQAVYRGITQESSWGSSHSPWCLSWNELNTVKGLALTLLTDQFFLPLPLFLGHDTQPTPLWGQACSKQG